MSPFAVGVPCYNRPDALWRTLRALRSAWQGSHLDGRDVYLMTHVDMRPDGSHNPDVLAVLRELLPAAQVHTAPHHRSCNNAAYYAFWDCFQHADFTIYIEEDVLVCQDFFDFVLAARERYDRDLTVSYVNSYGPESNAWEHPEVSAHLYQARWAADLHCYGCGLWARTWEVLREHWTKDPAVSWDVQTNATVHALGLRGICCTVPRCRNIGYYGGTYYPNPADWKTTREQHEAWCRLRWDADMFRPRKEPWAWPHPSSQVVS